MTAFLKTSDLTQDGFLSLIQNLTPDIGTLSCRVLLEAPDGWALDWWDWKSGLDGELHWYGAGREPVKKSSRDCLTKSTAGRLFAPDGELRWRTIPALGTACWRVAFLGKVDWTKEVLEDHSYVLNGLHSRQESFYLWGQQTPETPDEWIELRIPHRFQYPIKGKSHRVKVVTEQWNDDTGDPQFVRLCSLKPYEEKM